MAKAFLFEIIGGTNVADTTATPSDVLAGKDFYNANGEKVQGTIPTYSGAGTVTQNGTLGVGGKYVAQDIEIDVPTGGSVAENDVTFYDYDGTIVASYTAADFANVDAMPANPSHTGLTAQGWNWTLADAKTYVASYGKLNIGQMYSTASGKTEYDIEVNEATGFTAILSSTSGTEKDWGDGTVDTNTSHTYATAGSYTIKLSGTTLPIISNSKKVRAVRIANGVTGILDATFSDCRLLQSVTIPISVVMTQSYLFQNCRSLRSVTIPSNVTSILYGVFQNCYSLQSITIPSNVTSIGTYTFRICSSLRSVTIPSNVTSISDNMFYNCYSLQSITIPSNVTSIGTYAIYNCYPLQSITMPSNVTSIGIYAISGCYSLQSITIPSNVTSIGTNAFTSCSWLTIVIVLATTPPTVASNSFPSNVTKIYIPHGTLATYQADTNWSTYASKLVELPA